MTKLLFMPKSEPFFFRGHEVGCLLIHGFTATPKEIRLLGEHLAHQGYTVFAPRLTHHGTQPQDMIRSHWQDWFYSALDGWYILRGSCRYIIPVGLSMGGVIALLLAAHYSVDGLVTMSTPAYLKSAWYMSLTDYIWRFMPYKAKSSPIWDDKSMAQERIAYPKYSVKSVGELRRFVDIMRASLGQVTAPTLLMHSRADRGVLPENMQYIYNNLASQDKEMIWLERSGHIITEDSERQVVFSKISTWLSQRFIPLI